MTRLNTASAAASAGNDRFSRSADNAFKSLGKWGNQLQWTGRQLEYNWTLPIIAAGGAATKFALDQERAMTRVAKVYGDAALQAKDFVDNELEALNGAFVALSNRFGVNMEETANIAAEWAAAGASGVALARNVKLTMQTMVLGELDAAKATEALIAIQAQYRFDSEQLADTMARLNAIENETGTTTADLIAAMSRAAGVARAAGVDVQTLGGMVAALTPAAGSAREAGNALKTMISRLMSPTGEAADVMREMGLNIDDAGWQSMNATARFQAMADVYDTLTDSQKAVVAATVASRYHINKFEVLMESMRETQSYYNKALLVAGDNADYFNTAERELNKVLDSNPQKVKQAGVILQNSMVKVIQPLLPMIVGMAQVLSQAAAAFANVNPEVLKLIGVGLLLLATLGVIARYVGSMATLVSVLGRAFSGLRPALAAAGSAFGIFGSAADQEVEEVKKKAPGKLREALTTMRDDINKRAPWMVTPFTKARMGILKGWDLLRTGTVARLVLLRNTAGLVWFSMLGSMRITFLAWVARVQTVLAAQLLPSFAATMARLRLTMVMGWAIMMLKVNLIFSGALAAMRARWAAFGAWWLGAQIALHARATALMAAAGARMAAVWAAVHTGIIRVQMAGQAVLATLTAVWQRGIVASTMRLGAILPMLWIQVWGAIQTVWYAAMLRLNALGLWFGRAHAAIMGTVGTLVGAVWAAAGRAWFALSWAIYGTMSKIAFVGGAAVTRAWTAATALMTRTWGAILVFMRAQWMAFIAFMRTPGALVGMFKGMGRGILAGGRGIMALLAALRTGIIAMLTSPWGIAILAIITLLMVFRNQIAEVWNNVVAYFSDASNGIVQAFDQLPNGVKNAFLKVVAFVKAAAEQVYEWMQYLNPFARHSPSLVENVTNGMAAVVRQFGTVTQVAGPINQAYAAIERLKDVSASLRQGAASIKLAEQIKELSEVAPQVVPAFRALGDQLAILQARADALDAVIKKQQGTVDSWQRQLDAASEALDRQKDKLSELQDVADGYEDSIQTLQSEIERLSSTPIRGMGAMADAIFENEMAQKRLRLEIMNLEDAGHTYEDVQSKIASLAGEIETLRGTQADLRAGGAGSEILGFYDQQIAALEAQQKATEKQVGPINEAQKALEDLERQAERMDLEGSLRFDPLTRQIEQAANTMEELPFNEIISSIQQNQRELGPLQTAWEQANAAVERQQGVVDAAQAEHDRIQATFDQENEKLQALKDAYGEVSGAIGDVNTALNDMQSAVSAARGAGEGAISPALENFRTAAGGEDFANVGGNSIIGREGGLGDQTGDIEAFTKQIEDELGASFAGLDMFKPFRNMWNSAKQWVVDNLGPFVQPIRDFFSTIFDGVDFMAPLRNLGSGFDLSGLVTRVGEWLGEITEFFVQLGTNIWQWLGQPFQDTVGLVWDFLSQWWEWMTGLFAGEGGGIFNSVIDAAQGLWNVLGPIVNWIIEGVLMLVHIVWQAFNGVLGPALDLIFGFFTNLWQTVSGVIELIAGIFTGDWKRAWEGFLDIVGGIGGMLWSIIKGIPAMILGGLWGLIKGIGNVGWAIIQGIWDGISAAWTGFWNWIGGLWNSLIDWVKDILGISSPSTVFAQIGGWLLQGLLNGVKAAASAVWSWFGGLGGWILEKVGNAAALLWQKGIDFLTGLGNGIVEGAVAVWTWWDNLNDTIRSKIGDAVAALKQKGIDFLKGLRNGIVEKAVDVWTFFTNLPSTIKTKIGEIGSYLKQKGIDFLAGLYLGISERIEGIKTWFKNLPGNIATWIGNVGSTLKQIGTDILNGFGNGINSAWETIKEKAKTPVKWVVDVIWNDGLRKLWNTMNNLWGGDDLDRFVFRAARGGVVPGYRPGIDTVPAMLSPGEGVLRPEATRAMGGEEGIGAINRAARLGGVNAVRDMFALVPQYFANGGVVSLPGWIDTLLDWVPGGGTISDLIDYINSNASGRGGGLLADLVGIPKKVISRIWEAVENWWNDDEPKSTGGLKPTGGGSWVDQMFGMVKKAFPRAKLNSGQRNTSDWHGRGKAIDLGEQGFAGGSGRRYMADMEQWIYKNVANITELIYNGLYDRTSNMKNGAKYPYSKNVQDDHRNHLHWAQERFDRGGIMRGAGVNTTGKPERVLSPRQTAAFDRLINFLDRNGIPSVESMEGAIFRATVRAQRSESIGGQVVINGEYGTTNVTNNFYGDMSFPNVSDGSDAEDFIRNLGDLAGAR